MRKNWDNNVEDMHFIEKVGVGAYHVYNKVKKVLIVESRDFVMDFFTNWEANGSIYIIISSNPDLYEAYPKKKGVTRAESPVGGWIITPDASDPNKCWVKLIVELDFKGPMPDIAIKTAFKDQGY